MAFNNKKNVDCEHVNVANMYFKGVSQKCYASQEFLQSNVPRFRKLSF